MESIQLEKIDSQEKKILQWLTNGGTLTPLEALRKFGCLRLGARIYDLSRKGFKIKKEMIKLESGKRVARYSIKQ